MTKKNNNISTNTYVKQNFNIQFHVTVKCQQKCSHCYIHDDPTYKSQLQIELSFEDCTVIMDDYQDFLKKFQLKGGINFIGGDPLLRKDIISLCKEAHKRGFGVAIAGNPFLLTQKMVRKIKEAGVTLFQLSLDGLEETHDKLRKKGSFGETLRAISELNDGGVISAVSTTLSRENLLEIEGLANIISRYKVKKWAISRMVEANKNHQQIETIQPEQYQHFLGKMSKIEKSLQALGTTLLKKCHLWELFDHENGTPVPNIPGKNVVFGGCSLGRIAGMVILPDGNVHACRRFPSKIGKVPEQKLFDIYTSEAMNSYRDFSKLEKCSGCSLLYICRGCPAVAYGVHGRWTGPDPQCWKAN